MGIELDVLTGHPEHDLLFVVSQVAKAAGIKNFYVAGANYRKLKIHEGMKWLTLSDVGISLRLSRGEGPVQPMPHTTSLMSESHVYQMLLRSKAPATEPFRKWVIEEVLPTIRKTGSISTALLREI